MTDAGYGIPEVLPSVTLAPTGQLSYTNGSSFTEDAFLGILKEHGVWMVYIRGMRDFPCPVCRPGQQRPGEGDGSCPGCLGLGYRAKLERAQVFLSKGRRMMPGESDIIPGLMGDTTFRAYFKGQDQPQTGDLLLEVTWSVQADRIKYAGEPTKILHVYALDQVEPFYFGSKPLYSMSALDLYDHHLEPIIKAITERRRA